MRIALWLARRGLGTTAPNPSVGAVIVDGANGALIALGQTQPGGRPHAETEALRRAGELARGASLYVTLEPCAHHGGTPPCADAIIAAGIARVVSGIEDPNPLVKGLGHARLKAAGIEVTTGVLAAEAVRVTLGHVRRQTVGRPAVTIKIALDEEGAVPFGYGGRPRIVTGDAALKRAHLMRAHHDAILVGGGTVRDDDPLLTCRVPGFTHRSPLRIVVTSRLQGLERSKLIATAREVPVLILTGPEAAAEDRDRLAALGVTVIEIASVVSGKINVDAILALLTQRGITRLLVEGGPAIWKSFFEAGAADEVTVFLAGQGGPVSARAPHLGHLAMPASFRVTGHRDLGADRMFEFARSE